MNLIDRVFRLLLLSLCLFAPLSAQTDSSESDSPFSYQLLYTADWAHALRGGIRTGSGYLGMGDLCLGLDLAKAGIAGGGSFFLKAAYTAGATPSATLFGDFQVASNIEAGSHTYLQELWYKQPLGSVTVIVGLQDLNALFAVNEHSGFYLNSSSGVPPTISHNIPAPIFPLTTPGITAVWNASERIVWQAALYDGAPEDFRTNPHNLKWHLSGDDGALAITELHVSTAAEASLRGTYKLGLYDHTHFSVYNAETQLHETRYRDNYGIYVMADQMISGSTEEPGSLALFARASISPKHPGPNSAFIGGGIDLYGAFGGDPGGNVLGAAVAHAVMTGMDDETAIELTYNRRLTGFLFLQPDFQYIIHPAGAGEPLKNCVAVILRIGVSI
jgi:porin